MFYHNEHKTNYLTVAEAIRNKDFGYTSDCWVNDEQRQLAISNNECWAIQWYPDTPVGFCIASACDLPALICAISEKPSIPGNVAATSLSTEEEDGFYRD